MANKQQIRKEKKNKRATKKSNKMPSSTIPATKDRYWLMLSIKKTITTAKGCHLL
jgi:hypothetical protein